MNYQVRRQGRDLGMFSPEELRRDRESGALSGNEYVQAEGASDWQPLDLVLQQGYRIAPPPLPSSFSTSNPHQTVIWAIVVGGIIFFVTFFGYVVNQARRGYWSAINQPRTGNFQRLRLQAMTAASKPILWTTTTLTETEANRRAREFRIRQWLDGYELRGQRNSECDAKAIQFLQAWIAHNYASHATNAISLEAMSDELATDTNCTDPLVLTMVADNSPNWFQARNRFQRALVAFLAASKHKAYPKFYATVRFEAHFNEQSDRVDSLDSSALQLLEKSFADGSFTSTDQQEIAEIFINAWGYNFFQRNAASVCKIVRAAGPDYQWLALVLDGENNIIEAWRARGGGYVNTVTSQGWQGFNSHLAAARDFLTQAWKLHPDFPLAPCRMIYVSLGDSDITEMRLWFDRTTTAQIDYSRAWKDLRWGLRPRWYGDEASMLAFGMAAINSGRFDTDVPRKFFDSVSDVESEMELPADRHIYGRDDVWPSFKRMYDGYIAASSQQQYRDSWRSSYAIVAYLAGKFDAAREQLEAVNWKLEPENLTGWGKDLSLMPLEVAARTGSLGRTISAAETAREADDISSALKKYSDLNNRANADAHTKKFIQLRLSQLAAEQRLQKGDWLELLPASDDDPNWKYSFGAAHRLPDGSVEVESGPKGHMLFSRTRVGENFEVRGTFEVVHSSNKNFQAGIVMGVPDFDSYNWYGFRIKRHDTEGDVVCLGEGWSRRQIMQTVALNDATNTFDFIFQNGKVTASVNGLQVFDQAAPPAIISVPHNSYLLGLGAFNDSADTIIRYRDVQARQLH